MHSVSQILAGALLGFTGASFAVMGERFIIEDLYDKVLLYLAKVLDGRTYHESGDSASYVLLIFKAAFAVLGACVVFHRELLAIAKFMLFDKLENGNRKEISKMR